MTPAVSVTHLPLPGRRQGKVRDIYDCPLPDGSPGLLIVATDRVSAFDVPLASPLPGKGILLTQISRFWFSFFGSQVAHHMVSTEVDDIPGLNEEQRTQLRGRIMLCRKLRVIPIECIVRGYLAGSGWKEYQHGSSVCGLPLPAGLRLSERLSEALFTPSTKAESGHDENISFAQASDLVGAELCARLRDLSLSLYQKAQEYALSKGIILADTKLEFGLDQGAGEPVLIDEIFTPDSSRFWPLDSWQPGQAQDSLDKQHIRDYLETVVEAGKWDKTAPGPSLPDEVIKSTLSRYRQACTALTLETPAA